jgi:tetratricopeptide (TPR) repeat protein
MSRIFRIILLLLLPLNFLQAQENDGETLYNRGLEYLKNGSPEAAAQVFRNIMNDSSLVKIYPETLYWLVKTDILLENYDEAGRAADGFLSNFKTNDYREELIYQRGRLYFLDNNPDEALRFLGSFITEYPESPFVSSAYYWIGESLVSLGRLEEADAVFSQLLSSYPESVKREAARYRRSEISLLYRERELLDLLRWSHEEYLQDSEDFYRRENSYKEEIAEYRKAISEMEENEKDLLESEHLLHIREQLLSLREYYINELLRLYDER